MTLLAIDPGYDRVGIAILERKAGVKEKLIFSECFKTNSKEDLPDRIYKICERIESLTKKFKPTILAIETLFFKNNKKTGMGVAEARGAIIVTAKRLGLEIDQILPVHIKTATTGYGKANKNDVNFMVSKLIDLPDKKMIDDEIDAIAIGLTYFATHRQ